MVRYSPVAIFIKLTLSTLVFLITAYAFLLRSSARLDLGEKDLLKSKSQEFCLVLNAFKAENFSNNDQYVTLVTQSSLHYLTSALEQSKLWDGPVSYALYLPEWTWVEKAYSAVSALRQCSSDFLHKVSVHIFYPSADGGSCPVRNPPSKSSVPNLRHCQSDLEKILRNSVRGLEKSKFYPVNTARNMARKASVTSLSLAADVELMPSPRFAPMFMEFYKNRHNVQSREAFVVPVFELDLTRPLPKTVEELHDESRAELALPFHSMRIAYECHRIPYLGKWWQSGAENRTRIGVFSSIPWIRPCWEPVFLSVSSETPLYDERFRGYGKNKIQQVYEMCRSNFTFHILDNAFFIHRNISVLTENEWSEISHVVQNNNELYERFRRELDDRYTNSKQREFCDTNVIIGTPFIKRL